MLTYGYCHRYAPTQGPLCWVRPQVEADAICGEWADGTITPEQEKRRELVRRFAVAIVAGDAEATGARYKPSPVWMMAEQLADAEPKNGGAR